MSQMYTEKELTPSERRRGRQPIQWISSADRVAEYRKGGYWTHGLCKACDIAFAWQATTGTRLKDGPQCTECGKPLKRTSLGNLHRPRVLIEAPHFPRKPENNRGKS